MLATSVRSLWNSRLKSIAGNAVNTAVANVSRNTCSTAMSAREAFVGNVRTVGKHMYAINIFEDKKTND